MKSPKEYKPFEFIHDPQFIQWVLNPTEETDQFWEDYLNENPLQKKELEQAHSLIKGLVHNEKSLKESEVLALWDRIENTRSKGNLRYIYLKRLTIAASLIITVGISGWLLSQQSDKKTTSIDYQSIAGNNYTGNNIELILSDKSQKIYNTKEVELKYDHEGKLVTKTGNQVQTEELGHGSDLLQMNQLVVPRGKRSNIELADGTKLWLNSGSRAIYPVKFNGKTREIYIEGEGYLEVAHDVTKPFYVVTDQVKVKVLGTKFDISAYRDDNHVSVVLVEGSVLASFTTENLTIKPDQILIYQKLTKQATLEKTNVLDYISWKDGWMLCNKEKIRSITTKLSRYYNVQINCTDQAINSMTLTGKLDLKSNYEDILKVICSTAPLNYEIVNNTINLTLKQKQ